MVYCITSNMFQLSGSDLCPLFCTINIVNVLVKYFISVKLSLMINKINDWVASCQSISVFSLYEDNGVSICSVFVRYTELDESAFILFPANCHANNYLLFSGVVLESKCKQITTHHTFFLNAPLVACIKVHYKAINGLSRSHMELITLKQAIFSKQN